MGFSADNVVESACRQPLNFVKSIEYRRQCLEHRVSAKMQMERIQAEVELALRKTYRENGEKITEATVAAFVLTEDSCKEAADKFNQADVLDEYSKLVVEAFRMNRDCLRIVGDLTRDEMSLAKATEASAEKLEATRRGLRERFPGR